MIQAFLDFFKALSFSMQLLLVLFFLMIVNQIIGTSYGSLKNKFQFSYFLNGIWKMVTILIAYGALALTAELLGEFIPEGKYLSGVLIDPIVRYYAKIYDSLRKIFSESTPKERPQTNQKPDVQTDKTEPSI